MYIHGHPSGTEVSDHRGHPSGTEVSDRREQYNKNKPVQPTVDTFRIDLD